MCCGSFMVSSTSSTTSIKFQVHATHTHTHTQTLSHDYSRAYPSPGSSWPLLINFHVAFAMDRIAGNSTRCQLYTSTRHIIFEATVWKRTMKNNNKKKLWQNYIKWDVAYGLNFEMFCLRIDEILKNIERHIFETFTNLWAGQKRNKTLEKLKINSVYYYYCCCCCSFSGCYCRKSSYCRCCCSCSMCV